MGQLFTAGCEFFRSELTALGAEGPYRLTITHGRGAIVEYFRTTKAALVREAELADLLMSARGAGVARKGAAV